MVIDNLSRNIIHSSEYKKEETSISLHPVKIVRKIDLIANKYINYFLNKNLQENTIELLILLKSKPHKNQMEKVLENLRDMDIYRIKVILVHVEKHLYERERSQ